MSKICSLFSGSSGNCTFLGCGDSGVLIDIGVSAKRTAQALQDIAVDPGKIQGIFLTHEHRDHTAGVRVFAARHKIPVFGLQETMLSLDRTGDLQGVDGYILDMPHIEVGAFCLSPFATSHDTPTSCGYRIDLPDGRTAAVCTDLGFVSEGVRQALAHCDCIVMESNHDVDMVKTGSYPYYLKERILGRRGHLSNDACAAELPRLVELGTTRIILSHLSKENNLPALAERTAKGILREYGMTEGRDFLLSVAAPCGNGAVCL